MSIYLLKHVVIDTNQCIFNTLKIKLNSIQINVFHNNSHLKFKYYYEIYVLNETKNGKLFTQKPDQKKHNQ